MRTDKTFNSHEIGGNAGHSHRFVKIAMITFGFDNSDIIKLLRKRGTAIKKENWA